MKLFQGYQISFLATITLDDGPESLTESLTGCHWVECFLLPPEVRGSIWHIRHDVCVPLSDNAGIVGAGSLDIPQ